MPRLWRWTARMLRGELIGRLAFFGNARGAPIANRAGTLRARTGFARPAATKFKGPDANREIGVPGDMPLPHPSPKSGRIGRPAGALGRRGASNVVPRTLCERRKGIRHPQNLKAVGCSCCGGRPPALRPGKGTIRQTEIASKHIRILMLEPEYTVAHFRPDYKPRAIRFLKE